MRRRQDKLAQEHDGDAVRRCRSVRHLSTATSRSPRQRIATDTIDSNPSQRRRGTITSSSSSRISCCRCRCTERMNNEAV